MYTPTYIQKHIAPICFGVLLFVGLITPFAIVPEVAVEPSMYSPKEDCVRLSSMSIVSSVVLAAQAPAGNQKPQSDSRSWPEIIGSYIGNLILSIAAFFTGVAGLVLDKALDELVFGMGNYVNDPGFGGAIDITWTVIRDLANLMFIFGFIYLGIRTIIDPESASVKRTLTQIIIGALLINFSLFIVKAIIDFSNFTAYHVYTALSSGSGSISTKLMDMMGLVQLYSTGNTMDLANTTGGGMIWFYIMGAIFLFIAAFVFFAAAILFVIRFVALVLIMIASPILFSATVFPKTDEYAKKLWGLLISYSLFAPLYLLLLLISMILMDPLIKIMTGNNQGGIGGALQNGGQADSYTVVISFLVMVFFLINSLLIAKKLGMAGASFAMHAAGVATIGTAAYIARSTIGRNAQNFANNQKLLDRAAGGGIGGWTARRRLELNRKIGDASFDARNIKSINSTLNTGDGTKGGFATAKKKADEKQAAYAKSLGEVSDDDAQVAQRKREQVEAQKQLARSRKELSGMQKGTVEYKDKLDEIDRLEKAEQKAGELYQQEKNRRVLGSTFTKDEMETKKKDLKDSIDKTKEEHGQSLNAIEKAYRELSDAKTVMEKGVIRSRIKHEEENAKKLAQALKDSENELKKLNASAKTVENGYADVLIKSNIFTAWPIGRSVKEEKASGAAIKKAFETKFKKSKEELQSEAILEELKKSK